MLNNIIRFIISRELWVSVAASIIAAILISIWNNISLVSIGQLFTKGFIKEVLTQPIPFYVVLLVAIILSIIVYIIRVRRRPGFLKETSMLMGNYIWHWRWTYDKKEKKYDMVDFVPLCPKCGKDLRMGIGQHYHTCVNNHQYNISNYFGQKSQIKSDIRKKYPQEADLILVDFFIG